MNILILSDSLALPRLKPEFCHQRDTWPSLLSSNGHHIIQLSIGGATSDELAKQCYYYKKETLDVDVVIIQSGIVDCAPRFATKGEVRFYRSMSVFGKAKLKLLNRSQVRRIRNITYTSLGKYAKNMQAIKDNFAPVPVFFLGILPAQDAYEKELRGIQKNTALYNAVLQNSGNFLDLSAIPPEGIMNDFHRLNATGHRFVFERIQETLSGL